MNNDRSGLVGEKKKCPSAKERMRKYTKYTEQIIEDTYILKVRRIESNVAMNVKSLDFLGRKEMKTEGNWANP